MQHVKQHGHIGQYQQEAHALRYHGMAVGARADTQRQYANLKNMCMFFMIFWTDRCSHTATKHQQT
jgi:hypothetical protein